jgi:hypothetical protein
MLTILLEVETTVALMLKGTHKSSLGARQGGERWVL